VNPAAVSDQADASVLIGFDYGRKRIGVASGTRLLGVARGVAVVAHRAGVPDWERLDALVADYRPRALVVGLPLHADGAAHDLTGAARAFGAAAGARWGLEVHFVDETLSSVAAERRLAHAGVRLAALRARRDAEAAAVILETWLGAAA
jgi:putative holliday junction resolvase